MGRWIWNRCWCSRCLDGATFFLRYPVMNLCFPARRILGSLLYWLFDSILPVAACELLLAPASLTSLMLFAFAILRILKIQHHIFCRSEDSLELSL